jgi:hypothetical protein
MAYRVAAIDVHKMVLIVAVATAADEVPDAAGEALEFECRRFGGMAEERKHLIAWLEQRGVQPGAQGPAQGETDPGSTVRIRRRQAAVRSQNADRCAARFAHANPVADPEAASEHAGPDRLSDRVARFRIHADFGDQTLCRITFPPAEEFASWFGGCPGSSITAEQNHNTRSPRGNRYVRKLLTQAAQAAVKKKGSFYQSLFRRFLPRLTYPVAVWAVAHRLGKLVWKILHQGVRYVERGEETTPQARKRRAPKLTQALRKLGYAVTLSP